MEEGIKGLLQHEESVCGECCIRLWSLDKSSQECETLSTLEAGFRRVAGSKSKSQLLQCKVDVLMTLKILFQRSVRCRKMAAKINLALSNGLKRIEWACTLIRSAV